MPEYTAWAAENLILPDTLPACIRTQVSEEDIAFAGRYGQIQLILASRLTGDNSRLQVLSGFSSFFALKNAGFSQITCRILPGDLAPVQVFNLRILHEREAFQNSPILQAWLLNEAQDQLHLQDLLPLLPLIALKPQPHILKERIRLLQLDDTVQTALHRQELQSKNLPQLLRLPEEEQKRLLELISLYRLGGSKQQKLIELVVDLHLRDGRRVGDILAEWRQSDPPRDNLPQESQSLLNFLHLLANPRLAQAEAQFAEQLRRLQAPAQVSVSHTPAFEDAQLSVQINYSSWKALQAHWPQVLKAVEKGNQDR